ncbi:hypothetical protein NEOLI_004919 [Neolecta irregularis DAH-3]|uniref:DUF7907 domain-containing protein n=1 Tax=Neolecta irregularis (strain DAH-3) TaxID=1198029 RepID=A0A1U7LPE5_NEOID|nr:hypothetical protein NEOLI_004919 [Neolecta irregularis DAH-3]|eukprot:OLL24525.1 hypothetical protein NEOLI_004919 [Neolecta irregularis DAH-3]
MKSIIATLIVSFGFIALHGSSEISPPFGPTFYLKTSKCSKSEYNGLFLSGYHVGPTENFVTLSGRSQAANLTSDCPTHTVAQVITVTGPKGVLEPVPLQFAVDDQKEGTNVTPLYFVSKQSPGLWTFDCDNFLMFNGSLDAFAYCNSQILFGKQVWGINLRTQAGALTNKECYPIVLQAVFG